MSRFEIGADDFLLDGRPLQIISGALHYFRVHPDQWADRIHKARLLGLNTVETYVAWNFHSPEPGVFDTTGDRDLGRFLDLVAAEGLHAIVRPGPYICAEWENGGLPTWLTRSPGVGLRSTEATYIAAVGQYLAQLAEVLAPRLITAGGPILMLQVENEYGAYGQDPDYLRTLVDLYRANSLSVPLFTCDQANDEMLGRGGLPELLRTATFGSRSRERLATLRRHQPTGPLMCMEFWNGWFDSWGLPHHAVPAEANARELDELLDSGASVNLYMFHGGTNFGLRNGANHHGVYRPITTSYDYGAPLAEDGTPTPKYWAFRDVIARHAPVPDEAPPPRRPAPAFDVALDRHLDLWSVLGLLGTPERCTQPPTSDSDGASGGFALYRTAIRPSDAVLSVADIRDHAEVFLDHTPVGRLSRSEALRTLALPREPGDLELLVEDRGRVNYGRLIGEPKGLIGPARTATRELTGWQFTSLDLSQLPAELVDRLRAAAADDPCSPLAGPQFRYATFDSSEAVDHFLAPAGWGRGLAWINGFLLGRYSGAGPTRTLYVPAPIIRTKGNEIVLFETQAADRGVVSFVACPDLGSTEQ